MRRWEAAQFHFTQVIQINAAGPTNALGVLVQLAQASQLFTEAGDNLIRRILIGGIVWDSYHRLDISQADDNALVQEGVIAERVDNTGQPVQIWNPWLNTEPLGTNDETILPVHVYRRRIGAVFNASASEELSLQVRPQDGWPTQSVRIKRAINDFTGLYFHLSVLGLAVGGASLSLNSTVTGTLYFRYRT